MQYFGPISAAGTALFGSALVKMGVEALTNPQRAASGYGLDAKAPEAERQVRIWGVREVAYGASVLALLIAGESGLVADGRRCAGLLTVIGGCVGLGDSMIIVRENGKGAEGHAAGGLVFGIIGFVAYLCN